MPSHTYHCICTELILATHDPLHTLPKRQRDGSAIYRTTIHPEQPVAHSAMLSDSAIEETTPVVLKLEDGFEKRYYVQCARCDLKIAYRLDRSSFEGTWEGVDGDTIYLLPGGLMSTEEMVEGKDMSGEIEVRVGMGG